MISRDPEWDIKRTSKESVEMQGDKMATNCVVAVFDTMKHAQLAVHILERAGFAPDHVSLVTRHIPEGSKLEEELSIGDDAERDAVIGAALGGLAGVLGDATLFFITGLGAVVAAGPLVMAAGAVIGGIIGAMEGWGVHHSHLRGYEDYVRKGKVLVVVDGLPDELMEAEDMLAETDASEVHLHAETGEDSPEVENT